MSDIVEDCPGLHVNTISSYLVVINSVEEQRQGLQEDKSSHNPMYSEHLLRSILLQNKDPEASREEEENGQHLIQSRQRHLPCRQVAVRVLLLNFYGEIHRFPLGAVVVKVVKAVVEEHAVK